VAVILMSKIITLSFNAYSDFLEDTCQSVMHLSLLAFKEIINSDAFYFIRVELLHFILFLL